jgi:hypothetical protein
MRIQKWIAVLTTSCTLAAALGTASLAAQSSVPAQPPSIETPDAPDAAPAALVPVRGELTEVDAKAKTLSVLTATATTITFAYTDATQVSGARDNLSGLATLKNVHVTVHFSEDMKTKAKTATRIEVLPNPIPPSQLQGVQPKPADPSPRD